MSEIQIPAYWYGQQIKKKPVIVKKVINLPEIKDKFSSNSYYGCCRSLVRVINSHFGWDPDTIVIKNYEEHYDDIVKFILDRYMIRDHTVLTAKMATLSYPMKLVGYQGLFVNKRQQLMQLPIEIKPKIKDIVPWDEMKQRIQKMQDACKNRSGKVVCVCYKHGYVLRLNEIVNTSVNPHQTDCNFLDLKTNTWYIKRKHSKTRTDREFKVSDEFVKELLPLIHSNGRLVCRRHGAPYKGILSLKHIDLFGLKVTETRNSYETWNHGREDVSTDDKNAISINVLGHCPETALAHYTNNDLAIELMNSDDET